MQGIHAFGGEPGGGGGRFFGGGDRRLRPHNHQALKCPRCDSLNTKFCYYNNYNLSQPRHFCKSCRRYWTRGGVLRNVPVGGGCRKAKRSKPKSSVGAAASSGDAQRERSQSSSSESSSLTAAATPVAEEGSAPMSTSDVVYPFLDTRFFNRNPNIDPPPPPIVNQPTPENQIFLPEESGYATLMASYGRAEQVNQALVSDNIGQGMSTDGLAPEAGLDWGSGGGGGGGGESDQGMFDLTAAVDPAYWSQPPWTDNDQSLNYLP